MAVEWAGLAVVGAGIAIDTLFGIRSGRAQAMDAEAQGRIGARQTRRQGVETIGNMELGMAVSGVETTERTGRSNASYSEANAGFFFGLIGKEDGGIKQGGEDFSGRTDTTGLLLDLTEEAIALDASAIEQNAAAYANAARANALSRGIGGLANLGAAGINQYNSLANREIALKGADADLSMTNLFFN